MITLIRYERPTTLDSLVYNMSLLLLMATYLMMGWKWTMISAIIMVWGIAALFTIAWLYEAIEIKNENELIFMPVREKFIYLVQMATMLMMAMAGWIWTVMAYFYLILLICMAEIYSPGANAFKKEINNEFGCSVFRDK